jgi:hypothetical protein
LETKGPVVRREVGLLNVTGICGTNAVVEMMSSIHVKGHVACMEHYRNAFTILVRRHEENRALKTAHCRWENIEMAVKVVGFM